MSSIDLRGSQNLLIGTTGSGKSTLVKKLLKTTKWDLGMIFTTTPWEYSDVKKGIPLEFALIDKVNLLFSPKLMKLKKFVIIDNYIGIMKLGALIEKIYTQGRHFGLAVFVLSQYAAKVPPVVRENSRYVWILRANVRSYDLLFNNQNKFSRKLDFIEFCQKNTSYIPILINNEDLNLINNIVIFRKLN